MAAGYYLRMHAKRRGASGPAERFAMSWLRGKHTVCPYLRHEAFPLPLSWNQVADELGALQPDQRWTAKRAEHLFARLRERLAKQAVTGLTRAEVGEPVGNTLNHNLITELLLSATLVPPDLRLLDADRANETRPGR